MKLILTRDVDSLGHRGDVVEVSKGYARNFLLPRNLAIEANEGALAQADRIREARLEAEHKAREHADEVAAQLVGSRVVIAARAGDEGQLYGSVGIGDVAEGIRRFTGVELDRSQIHIPQPVRSIGLHEIQIRLHPEVEFPLTLDVIPT
jgi:large subunit ribosomal protein L9